MMGHPITGKRRSVLIYSLVWLVIAVIHGASYWYLERFSVSVYVTDPVVTNLIFAVLGLLAWYPTRYIPFQRHTPVYSLLAHMVAGLLVLVAWMTVSVGLLNLIFASDGMYLEFLNRSLVFRGTLGVLVYLVLVLVYYLATSAQKLQERTRQEERLKNLVREAELNMLKSQINPHFLFNSLNSISSLTMSSPDEARDMIIRLSDFLRYSLKHRENESVPLREEIGRMKDYLAIEKIRFGDKLRYEFNVSGACEDFPVPTMIFQPLFENAIRHSVYESTDPVMVSFDCRPEKDMMKTVVVNDYDPGIPSKKGTGVGLQNVKQRIDLVYNGQGVMHWKGDKGKFEVTILFPRIFVKS